MSDTDETLKRISTGREIFNDRDFNSVVCFCCDLRMNNWAGNPPICNLAAFRPCAECFGCEAGNHMLRYLRLAL